MLGDQIPLQSIKAVKDYFQGNGDPRVNLAQALGPLAGVTFSYGAPGGEAVGEMYRAKDQHEFAVNEAMPEIRDQIRRGDIDEAIERMKQLGMSPGYQKWVVRTTQDPSQRLSKKGMSEFEQYATYEQKQRMQRALDERQAAVR